MLTWISTNSSILKFFLLNFFQFISNIIDICLSQQLWLAGVNDFWFRFPFGEYGSWKMPPAVRKCDHSGEVCLPKRCIFNFLTSKTHADKLIESSFLCVCESEPNNETFKMTSNFQMILCQRESIKSTRRKKLSAICHSSFRRYNGCL